MNLSNPIYHDADKAREHLEALLWADGPVCPHCQTRDRASKIKGGRKGLYFCNACRQQFTVTVGTVFERSKIPLNKWVLATHIMSASKTGVSAHQLHRMLDITYKSAWFLCHRIREAMCGTNKSPMGGEGEQVQSDETYFGNSSKRAKGYKKGHSFKSGIFGLVDPGTGEARAYHMKDGANARDVRDVLVRNASRESELHTDESPLYTRVGEEFDGHETVKHTGREYVRTKFYWQDGEPKTEKVHTNNVENYFGVFKRGMRGTYIHCGEQHLQRYLNEFSFRYTHRSGLGYSDGERTALMLKRIEGKRLTYR